MTKKSKPEQKPLNDEYIIYIRNRGGYTDPQRRIGAIAIGWYEHNGEAWIRIAMSLASKKDQWSRMVARKKTLGRLRSDNPDTPLVGEFVAGMHPERFFHGKTILAGHIFEAFGLEHHIPRVDINGVGAALQGIYARVLDRATASRKVAS